MKADFDALTKGLPQLTVGAQFGKAALLVGKKSVAWFTDPDAVFKLPAGPREEALALKGALLYDPAGKGHPMKEWVVVPHAHVALWPKFAQAAYRYLTAE